VEVIMEQEYTFDTKFLVNKTVDTFSSIHSTIPQVLQLVDENDPILKQGTEEFDFSNPPIDPVILYRNLGKTLIEHNALGLAAPQCGLLYRAFVMRAENVIGVFNPKVLDVSSETVILEEGCLSFPGMVLKVKRPKRIRVRYTEPDGNVVTRVFDGMSARCFLHEKDHLDGHIMHEKANRYHLEQAKKKRVRPQGSANG